MTISMKTFTVGAVAGTLLLGLGGCSDTALRGEVDDSEVRDPELIQNVVLGTAREVNDVIHSNGSHYRVEGMTDLITFAGTSSSEERRSIGDMRNRDVGWIMEQAGEAAWSSYKAADLLLGEFPDEYDTNPLVARAWLNASIGERLQGDNMCETVYQYGPFGGRALGNFTANAPDGFPGYDAGTRVQKDSIYKRVIYAANEVIRIAEAAKAAGTPAPSVVPEYFDLDDLIMAAHGQLAYAHHALATLGFDPQTNWPAALNNAALVETSFEELVRTDNLTRSNGNWSLSWANDDNSFWFGEVNGEMWGSAIGMLSEPGDTRGGVERCTDYVIRDGEFDVVFDDDNIVEIPGNNCGNQFRASDEELEIDEIPRWLPLANQERYEAVRIIEGTDMRLIEAERALLDGDLGTFTALINEVRSFYGAPTISQPSSVGALEYPNALDDGWSMLDRELVMNEARGDYRRLHHLHRLNHPFITENRATHPIWADALANSGLAQRYSCLPLPESECRINDAIVCEDLP